MPLIRETIVVTADASGRAHIAPLGLIAEGEHWIIAPFRPSTTLENLRARPFAVANLTDDARVFAGCLTGRRDWPLVAVDAGFRLAETLAHWQLQVVEVREDALRPRFVCRVAHAEAHAPFGGFNRAFAAVIEAAVLTSRLDLLPRAEIEAEFARLKVIVAKTAGPREAEAFGWLEARVAAEGGA
ncbi:MAG TPA: DUF447 domain-containing protein [Roseiarcus sp.]|nr:DUF447 domain-containing protein [Roseiarcus sp.]